jgi:hypothetical protein
VQLPLLRRTLRQPIIEIQMIRRLLTMTGGTAAAIR